VQLEILRLAAAGLKDDAIARALGRSSRWVRRHFEALEERLGATNRLTLGIAAARRGWV
jgi:DNA-binding NarL/FixJ family response regulator